MLTWKKFLEAKGCDIEDMEEKLGKDLDHDDEEGESKAHKKKVFGKPFGKKPEEDEDDEDDEDEEEEEEEDEE